MNTAASETKYPKTQPPEVLSQVERQAYLTKIREDLEKHNAVIVAHYYTDPEIQALAEETGGCVADSLEMARFGAQHDATTLIVAGVKFMGETAKILTPHKRVLMPTLEATCSLDISCPINEFEQFCDEHPDRTVVVYANTSAAVKARADWVITSSIAVDVVDYLDSKGEKLIWAPDRHLGNYIQTKTGADMLIWNGDCVVHNEFRTKALQQLSEQYPEAAILVHPESPSSVIEQADAVGSTSQLIKAAVDLNNKQFIVATDMGITYKMQQQCPEKEFIAAPTGGKGATCRSCAHCPWMRMNSLKKLSEVFEQTDNEILVPDTIIQRALIPLERMLNFNPG